MDHANFAAAALAVFSAFLSALFGVPTATILLAFSGSLTAISLTKEKTSILAASGFVVLGTTFGSIGSAGVGYALPGFPDRLSAFIIAVMAMPILENLIKVAGTIPEKWRDKWF